VAWSSRDLEGCAVALPVDRGFITVKINRGAFPAWFLIAAMEANRRYVAAGIGCLILSGVGRSADVDHNLPLPEPREAVSRSASQRNQTAGSPEQPFADEVAGAPKTIAGGPPVKPFDAIEYQAPCRQPANHEQCDLEAQWKAADGASNAARWSWWQMLISTFGLAGLMYNLVLTRKATNIAVEATKEADRALEIAARNADAATKQVAITEHASERQLRAYVFATKCLITEFDYDRGFTVEVEVKNFGNTPAYDLTLWADSFIDDKDVSDERFATREDGTLLKADVGPTAEIHGKITRTKLTRSDAAALRENLQVIYVHGELTYTDAFRRRHEGVFRFHFGRDHGLPNRGAMAYCPRGNAYDDRATDPTVREPS
jgi:hypothetical protein